MKNIPLRITTVFCIIAQIILLFLLGLTIAVFIHLQVNKDFYNSVILNPHSGSVAGAGLGYFPASSISEKSDLIQLNELDIRSQIELLVRTLAITAIFLMIVRLLNRFVGNVRRSRIFDPDNYKMFRKIGLCFLMLFVIQILPKTFGDQNRFHVFWDINLYYLVASAFSYLLSEVFKEGNLLRDESELTI